MSGRGANIAGVRDVRGVAIDFIRPGKPVDNSFVESFNGRLRDECLNGKWFQSRDEAREFVEAWREDYNNARPHSALGQLSPAQYRSQVEATGDRKKLALRRA